MKNYELKKVKKLILICVVVIAVLVGILLVIKIVNSPKLAQKMYGYENMGVYKETDVESEKNLEYINISVFSEFYGELPTSTMTKNIKNIFIKEIPKVIKDVQSLDKQELNSYYENNVKKIQNNLKIYTYEDFKTMIDKFSSLDIDLTVDYKSCEFIQESESIKVKLTYENGDFIICNIIGNSTNKFVLKF